MGTHSHEFVTTVATIAAIVQHDRRAWHPTRAVAFAWWSVGQVGDASVDMHDYTRHLIEYTRLCKAEGVDMTKEVD